MRLLRTKKTFIFGIVLLCFCLLMGKVGHSKPFSPRSHCLHALLSSPNLQNDTVVISSDCYKYNKLISINVLVNDIDSDGDLNRNSVHLVDLNNNLINGASFYANNIGTWSTDGNMLYFLPDMGFYGKATINYKAFDATGLSSTAQVVLMIGTKDNKGCYPGSTWDQETADSGKNVIASTGSTNPNNSIGFPDYDALDNGTYSSLAKNTSNFLTLDFSNVYTEAERDSIRIFWSSNIQGNISTIKIESSTNNSSFTLLGSVSALNQDPVTESVFKIPAEGMRYLKISYVSGETPRIDAAQLEKWNCVKTDLDIQDDIFSVFEDIPALLNVLNNDQDPSKTGLTLSIARQPANGIISLNSDNSITYVNNKDFPLGNQNAKDSFQYKVCNAWSICKTATARITIVNDSCAIGFYRPPGTVITTVSLIGTNTNMIDNYIKKDKPDENKGGSNPLEVGKNANERRALFSFNGIPGSIPTNAVINSAIFSIYKSGGDAVNLNLSAHKLLSTWTETGSTWKKKDGTLLWTAQGADFDATPASAIIATGANGFKDFNITNLAQQWINRTNNNYGLIIRQNAGKLVDKRHQYQSSESGTAAQTPKLIITYTTPLSCTAIINRAPLANPDYEKISLDSQTIIEPLLNDQEPDNNILSLIRCSPWNNISGIVSLNGNKIKYNPSFALPFPRTDTLKYVISDGHLTDSSFIFIDILFAAYAGNDSTICNSVDSIFIQGKISGNTTSCNWSSSGSGIFSNRNSLKCAYVPSEEDKSKDSIILYLSGNDSNSSCASAIDSKIIFFQKASLVNAGGPDSICQTSPASSILLSNASVGGGASDGTWAIVSGSGTLSNSGPVANPAMVHFTPADGSNGEVTLRLTSNAMSSCSNISKERKIYIYPLPAASRTLNSSCSDFIWNGIQYTASGTYTAHLNSSWGCDSLAILDLTILNNNSIQQQPSPFRQNICMGTAAYPLSISAMGDQLRYQWYVNSDSSYIGADSLSNAQQPLFTPTASDTANRYYFCRVTGTCGGAISSLISGRHKAFANGTWMGNSSNWEDSINWCGGVPELTTDVTIPSSCLKIPIIQFSDAACRHMNIGANSIVKLLGKNLKISGNITGEGILDAKTGSIELSGTNQQEINPLKFSDQKIGSVKINNPAGAYISNQMNTHLKITEQLSFGNVNHSVFNTNDLLDLKSDSLQTASVADLTNNNTNYGNSIIGNVSVERFILPGKKWRFLSIPTNTVQNFRQSWQENNGSMENNTPGYGILITDKNNLILLPKGFDAYSPGGPSLKKFDYNTQNYIGINSTHDSINTNGGYMTFIRGDRSCWITNQNILPTNIRTYGTLKQGSMAAISVPANGLADIGNPYASQVDVSKLETSGIQDYFWIWDPKLAGSYGLGGFQVLTKINNQYYPTPGGGSYPPATSPLTTIQSGQAFFVKGATSGGYIRFHENAKSSGNIQAFRNNRTTPNIRINIQNMVNGSMEMADGVLAIFDDQYSDSIDLHDAVKFSNSGINFSLFRNSRKLSVEKRSSLKSNDTLFLFASGWRIQRYRFEITLENMQAQCGAAFLIDRYKNKRFLLHDNEPNLIDAEIENIPGSYAGDRFIIVFRGTEKKPASIAKQEIINKSLSIHKTPIQIISISPNPVHSNNAFIEVPGNFETKSEIVIFNNSGQIVFKQIVTKQKNLNQFLLTSIPDLPCGLYNLVITDQSGNTASTDIIICNQ